MTIETIFEILKNIVRAYPLPVDEKGKPIYCKQLNTFAVIKDKSDLAADGMNMTIHERNKPFFYSRAWEADKYNPNKIKVKFPALLVDIEGGSIKCPFTFTKRETCYQLSMVVADELVKDCKSNCSDCDKRNQHEIEFCALGLLTNVLDELAKFQKVKGHPVLEDGYYHESQIEPRSHCTRISLPKIQQAAGRYLFSSHQNLYGHGISFEICLSDCGTKEKIELNFKEEVKPVLKGCELC